MSLNNPEIKEPLKIKLARALDDNLHTKQWHNIVDWLIVAMILISTTEIFLSTFDIDPELRQILWWVDVVTLVFFTIEVSLRIWVAPVVNPEFKGWRGRLKYCFTFYGAIDVISTFPFYLQWIFPLPVAAFKLMRTARVVRTMRIGRYSKSFNLLSNAIKGKRKELIVSMQFLIVITIILSLVLFFAEHDAQPDVYKNGFISVIWAFAQYIGDPGQFADTPPITGVGRIIACIVGLLGIAIVAVPAGIIGAGFTEALEKDAKRNDLAENTIKLKKQFQRKLDRPSGLQCVPPLVTLTQIQARTGLKIDDIIDVVTQNTPPYFRLVNTASTIPTADKPMDLLAVEHYVCNRSYGLYIDRGSKVTIINTSAHIDAGSGNFSFYLALIGGFNYISREVGDRIESVSYYQIPAGGHPEPEFADFASDLNTLLSRDGAWSLTFLVSSGALEPKLPTELHFCTGGAKGDGFDMEGSLVRDTATFKTLFDTITTRVAAELNLKADHQKYHASDSPRLLHRAIGLSNGNNIILRIEWDKILWSPKRMLLARIIAGALAEVIENKQLADNPELKQKNIGFDSYLEAVRR
ncbi:MAG: ion transporter [Muribaculaceae bacterium]|nr:ion transporter [Muribaculaceae bacterium]